MPHFRAGRFLIFAIIILTLQSLLVWRSTEAAKPKRTDTGESNGGKSFDEKAWKAIQVSPRNSCLPFDFFLGIQILNLEIRRALETRKN